MAENANNAPQEGENQPVFKMLKLFVKDMSFESPSAPEIFLKQELAPRFEINMGLGNKALGNDTYEVALTFNVTLRSENEEKPVFIIELEHCGVFLLQNIPPEYIQRILAVDCATYMFPFTRQLVCQATIDGGFPPFLMEPINFLGTYERAMQERQKQTAS